MWEKNLGRRAILILVVLAVAIAFLQPWDISKTLKGGLDIAGGVSMIFEIDDAGLADHEKPHVAENMKTLLQKRVDPQSIYNLTWRVIGSNRLEIQMPLAPAGIKVLREAYSKGLAALTEERLTRKQLEAAFRMEEPARSAEIKRLAVGSEHRESLIRDAAKAYDAYRVASDAMRAAETKPGQPASAPTTSSLDELELASSDAETTLQDAIDLVLAENFNPTAFQAALELPKDSDQRRDALAQFKKNHGELTEKIDQLVIAYDAWYKERGYLDGPADLKRLLKGAGRLDFRILSEPNPQNPTQYDRYRAQLKDRGPRPAKGDTEGWYKVDNPKAFFDLDTPADEEHFDPRAVRSMIADKRGSDFYVLAKLEREVLLATSDQKWQLKSARPSRDERGLLCVQFQLDVPGGQQFGRLTSDNIGRQLCIFLDDVAYSAANIRSKITESGQITGEFSPEKVNYLVQTMQAGALPARLKDTPLSERVIEASLGQENLKKAFTAGVIGLIIVAGFMATYYLVGGLIADVALLLNMILVLAAMAMLGARFTLDGIAGVILTIGMSVDANVLIFERMREEKERGSSLRMMIKNGYDKAFRTILDSHITTLLTSVILYYLGSEEVKGFALTLGWGLAISMFTALFVTRTILTAGVKYNVIKDVKMLHMFRGIPQIDWYGKRKIFIPISLTVTVIGLGLLFARPARELFDVEFLGGVSAVVELTKKSEQREIQQSLEKVGAELKTDADKLAQASVVPDVAGSSRYLVSVPGMRSDRLAAFVAEPLSDLLVRDGVNESAGGDQVALTVKPEISSQTLTERIHALPKDARLSGDNIFKSQANGVLEADQSKRGLLWNVVTTETNRRLVQHALVTAMGDKLQIRPRIRYELRGNEGVPFAITERRLEQIVPADVLPKGAGGDLTDFLGGAAIYLDDLNPPVSPDALRARLSGMRLQPGYESYPWRDFDVIGVVPAGAETGDNAPYRAVVVAIGDSAFPYWDDAQRWQTELAQKEQTLVRAALDTEQSLQKVTQFKPQIAKAAQTKAIIAIVMSWLMIIGYLWIRFGTVRYGVAGVVALVHDTCMALAFVGISGWIGGADSFGSLLLIDNFKINLPIIAALLTIIGFSINDTIVIFDRVRELRGRLGVVTPEIINRSVNETLSRTILTSATVFFVLLVMYIWGGSSIRGFSYCMLVGVITGTYSTVAIAAPLLLAGQKFEPAARETPRGAPVPV